MSTTPANRQTTRISGAPCRRDVSSRDIRSETSSLCPKLRRDGAELLTGRPRLLCRIVPRPYCVEVCERYPWPAIRELQNIVERSVILRTGYTFSIDEAWLSTQMPSGTDGPALSQTLHDQEREMIEAALLKSREGTDLEGCGRLGIPASTLESKITAWH